MSLKCQYTRACWLCGLFVVFLLVSVSHAQLAIHQPGPPYQNQLVQVPRTPYPSNRHPRLPQAGQAGAGLNNIVGGNVLQSLYKALASSPVAKFGGSLQSQYAKILAASPFSIEIEAPRQQQPRPRPRAPPQSNPYVQQQEQRQPRPNLLLRDPQAHTAHVYIPNAQKNSVHSVKDMPNVIVKYNAPQSPSPFSQQLRQYTDINPVQVANYIQPEYNAPQPSFKPHSQDPTNGQPLSMVQSHLRHQYSYTQPETQASVQLLQHYTQPQPQPLTQPISQYSQPQPLIRPFHQYSHPQSQPVVQPMHQYSQPQSLAHPIQQYSQPQHFVQPIQQYSQLQPVAVQPQLPSPSFHNPYSYQVPTTLYPQSHPVQQLGPLRQYSQIQPVVLNTVQYPKDDLIYQPPSQSLWSSWTQKFRAFQKQRQLQQLRALEQENEMKELQEMQQEKQLKQLLALQQLNELKQLQSLQRLYENLQDSSDSDSNFSFNLERPEKHGLKSRPRGKPGHKKRTKKSGKPYPIFQTLGKGLDVVNTVRLGIKKGTGKVVASGVKVGGKLAYLGAAGVAKVIKVASSI